MDVRKYRLTVAYDGTGVGPTALVATSAGGFPIGPWSGDNASSAWIVPTPDTVGPGDVTGVFKYRYTTTFSTPGDGVVTIAGQANADNTIVGGFIDTTAVALTGGGFNAFGGFNTLDVPVVETNHTITFLLQNGVGDVNPNGPTGLRVEFSAANFFAPPAPITGTPIGSLYSTGVNNAGAPMPDNTTPDPHWQLTAGPGGTNLGDLRVRTASGGFPIGPWLGDDAKSAWVGELSPNHDLSSAAGDYKATTTFTLPAGATSVHLVGRWSTDDAALELLLNGQQVDGPNNTGFTTWTEFDISSTGIHPGLNTFEARWSNSGGPGGVRVEFDEARFQTIPEPSSLLLFGLGVLAFIGLLRKRTV